MQINNNPNFPGETGLMYACRKNKFGVVRLFVEVFEVDLE